MEGPQSRAIHSARDTSQRGLESRDLSHGYVFDTCHTFTESFADTGEVYTAGRNHAGQCGTGNVDTSHVTRLSLTGVIQCAAGDCHSLFLDRKCRLLCDTRQLTPAGEGRVYGCGATQYGQLGSSFPNLDNHVLGDVVRTPQLLAEIPPMRSVAAGAHHSLLVDRKSRACHSMRLFDTCHLQN